MSEGPLFSGVIDDKNSRYVSEWDYFKAERTGDFDDAFQISLTEFVSDELLFDDAIYGSEERQQVLIHDATAWLATVPVENLLREICYDFELVWKDLYASGRMVPAPHEDVPFLRLELQVGEFNETFALDIDDVPHPRNLLHGREYASYVITTAVGEAITLLDRGLTPKFDPPASDEDGYKYA